MLLKEPSMRAVLFDKYGGIDVLRVADVPVPDPARGQVLVKVKAASINPGRVRVVSQSDSGVARQASTSN